MNTQTHEDNEEKRIFDLLPEALKASITDNFLFMSLLKKAGYKEYLSLELSVSIEKAKVLNEAISRGMSKDFANEMVDTCFADTEKGLKKLLEKIMTKVKDDLKHLREKPNLKK